MKGSKHSINATPTINLLLHSYQSNHLSLSFTFHFLKQNVHVNISLSLHSNCFSYLLIVMSCVLILLYIFFQIQGKNESFGDLPVGSCCNGVLCSWIRRWVGQCSCHFLRWKRCFWNNGYASTTLLRNTFICFIERVNGSPFLVSRWRLWVRESL